MNLAFSIAKRYLISKKSTNAINIIAGVSVIGMLVGTAALILVLSVFNGFEDLVKSLYNTFNPDFKVTPVVGKVFTPTPQQLEALKGIEGVNSVGLVLEENALLRYGDKDFIGRLKGVDDTYTNISAVDTTIIDGKFQLKNGDSDVAVIGVGVAGLLGISIHNPFASLKIFMPKREGKTSRLRVENAFEQASIQPVGVFSLQQDFDGKYVIVPLRFMHKLLSYEDGEVSNLEIAIAKNANQTAIQEKIQAILGDNFTVKNRYEQDALLYKVMTGEKWAVYFILTFILIVAAFNIIGSLSMLVIEKKHDIGILKAMGATKQLIKRIFLIEGILLSLTGSMVGMLIATLICLAQQHFKIIRLDGMSFLIDAYPVSMRLEDYALVSITVIAISILAAFIPAQRAAEQGQLLKKEA